ncbi:hypothetical protein FUA23_18245 [Neolewinella aurantiaca]|uniref:Uncharacterized protein n=1 Tax=Neolewinella aurantiaca TaxID=2602767 RepID=A0A5C7FA35_9BACT|nr:hypothetical protein [Neolewinella aurantiaca]TXF87641.1 hypothetical protein FUA23_18245 [Neolewinella aurantiaca]
MHPLLRKTLAVLAGWIGGSAVNMGLIQLGHRLHPISGVDPNDMEALAEIMPTLSPGYFVFPFLAHALGTLVGAAIAASIVSTGKLRVALVVGVIFFIGGIAVNFILPGPLWFAVVDLVVAYFPMAWLGFKIAERISPSRPKALS